MKKILSTRVLVKICVLTTILLILIIYTIWGNSALMVSMVNISSDRIWYRDVLKTASRASSASLSSRKNSAGVWGTPQKCACG